MILTAGRNQGWESWTRGKSREIYSSAEAQSMVLRLATRSVAISTGIRECVRVHGSIFAFRSDGKDDFAELRAGLEVSMGGSRFAERENAVNRGLEAPRGHQTHDAEELGLGAHVRAE